MEFLAKQKKKLSIGSLGKLDRLFTNNYLFSADTQSDLNLFNGWADTEPSAPATNKLQDLADVDGIRDQVDQVSSRVGHRFRKVGGQEVEELGP